jgi:hypothetical protein
MKKGRYFTRLLNGTLFISLLIWSLDGCRLAAADGIGGALNKALRDVDRANRAVGTATSAAVPSGAMLLLREVDKSLNKMDRMMSEEAANYDKDYRGKEASASLAEAKDNMKELEQRHGTKMGKDHVELVARRDRIAAAEKKLEVFQGKMAASIKQDQESRVAKDKADATADAARNQKNAQDLAQRQQQAQKPATAPDATGSGKILFSKSPINPANPQNLATQFKSGDSIYGLIQVEKTWRELFKAGNKTELALMVVMAIGDNQTYQYITLKKNEYLDAKQLVLDIAPAPDKMTAYRNPDIKFGEGKGNRKIGPIAFTYELAQLPPGKHRVEFFIRNYDEKPAAGELEIEGSDFKFYAGLHETIKAASDAAVTLPPAGMVNKSLEAEMRKLLDNAGWSNIRRIVIVDKDWWLEGGASRYLNVAAAAKGDDGQYYWCNLQFTQVKLISGAWGPLELTRTGVKRAIAEANIGK